MKKLLLSGLALTVCLSAFAQNVNREIQSKLNQNVTNKSLPIDRPNDNPVIAPVRDINPTVFQSRASMIETTLGTTQYDLQSNYGSVGNRTKLWDDNTISAVWTLGQDQPGFADRGTGYNYYNGTNWYPLVTTRIETFRTGWPNVSGAANSGEIIVNHTPTSMISRATKGSGAWTETTPLATLAVTWPRMVVGGANGNSVHVIGNENTGNFNMTYSRSVDGGGTWADVNILLPDFLTLHFEGSVDAYDIDARGDVIAIVMGGWGESLTLWKSLDNGATWNHTTINEFPLAPWDYTATNSDVDGDGVADTIWTTDGGISTVIDNNNVVHVAVGSMRVLLDAPSPNGPSYFPGTDGLLYWNETMPAGDITNNYIASAEDIDGNGIIDIAPDLPIYQCSLTGMPSLGVDASNNVHLVYSSIIEGTTNGGNPGCEQSFRNVYYMYSTDGGMNWSNPSRVEESDFDEMVWPSMAKRVNECVHVTYHKDGQPGNNFQPNPQTCHTYAPYEVIYTCIDNPVGINEAGNQISASVYPNPVASILNVDYAVSKSQSVTIQLVDVLGKVVYSSTNQAFSGSNNLKINVKEFTSGIYSLNIIADGKIKASKLVIQ